jgi:hypothetical protein
LPCNIITVSVSQIIEEIKALPPQEQARIVDFVNDLKSKHEVKYASDEEFQAAADEVFSKHRELLRRLAS